MIKSAIFFLLIMAAIGMIGNAVAPRSMRRILHRRATKLASCPQCGHYLIGKTDCDCKKD